MYYYKHLELNCSQFIFPIYYYFKSNDGKQVNNFDHYKALTFNMCIKYHVYANLQVVTGQWICDIYEV